MEEIEGVDIRHNEEDEISAILRTLETKGDEKLDSLDEAVEKAILEIPEGKAVNLASIYEARTRLAGLSIDIGRLNDVLKAKKYPLNNIIELNNLYNKIEDTLDAVEKQSKTFKRTTETLKRYGRETRQLVRETKGTLKNLVVFLKKEREESGHIPVTIVGSFDLELNNGEGLAMSPGATFTYEKGITRKVIYKQPYMFNNKVSFLEKISCGFKRLIVGESFLLDYYFSGRNHARLGISSDEVGGNILRLNLKDLESRELIARPKSYFGNETGVKFDVEFPLKINLGCDLFKREDKIIRGGFGRAIYGPAYVFQKFQIVPKEERTNVFLHVNGDAKLKNLGNGEILRLDPRFISAWESRVDWELTKFGSRVSRIIRGDIPYWVRFKGPGKVLYSDVSFSEGYLGYWFTPLCWGYKIKQYISSKLPF